MTIFYYVRPTDSLFVRGNLAFGDAGEHGSSLMPPPPSLFAGAFRSALLGRDATQLAAFVEQGRCTDAALHACLGTPTQPGAFALRWLSLAIDTGTKTGIEAIAPLPADLLLLGRGFAHLKPCAVPQGMQSSGDLPLRATLHSAKQEKPTGGVYLRAKGLEQHLQGRLPDAAHSVRANQLYQRDPRLGIGLDTDARTAEESLIYTTEGFAFSPNAQGSFASTGFLVGLDGVDAVLPEQGVLRLGGDGRSATYRRVDFKPPAIASISKLSHQRFRLVLQTPGLFSQGWLPEGVQRQDDGNYRLQGAGFSTRLACAALGRNDWISGWDLHQRKPKTAHTVAPAGSVYWFDQLEGDFDKLAAWVENGLWQDNAAMPHTARRAEGFNCALLAAWI